MGSVLSRPNLHPSFIWSSLIKPELGNQVSGLRTILEIAKENIYLKPENRRLKKEIYSSTSRIDDE